MKKLLGVMLVLPLVSWGGGKGASNGLPETARPGVAFALD